MPKSVTLKNRVELQIVQTEKRDWTDLKFSQRDLYVNINKWFIDWFLFSFLDGTITVLSLSLPHASLCLLIN